MLGVLERIEADEAHALFGELVTAKTDGEQIHVSRVPAEARDMLLFLLFILELPDWEQAAKGITMPCTLHF